jgi:pyoverdine/dityrosine biosynthesis protein Dit1
MHINKLHCQIHLCNRLSCFAQKDSHFVVISVVNGIDNFVAKDFSEELTLPWHHKAHSEEPFTSPHDLDRVEFVVKHRVHVEVASGITIIFESEFVFFRRTVVTTLYRANSLWDKFI